MYGKLKLQLMTIFYPSDWQISKDLTRKFFEKGIGNDT
jgi:hypothetical protein